MAGSSQSIGSLVIDLRANVAQLQTDMDSVKDLVTKSSSQMSAQMRSDMQETRGVLSLLRDDFGITMPREIAKMVASSEQARTAVLAIGSAIQGIAVLGIAEAAFSKLFNYLEQAQEQAAAEAKSTQDVANAAENAVEATQKRAEALQLIGKGEDERAAAQKAFYQQELEQNANRLKGLQGELQARLAILAAYDAVAEATPDNAASAEAGIDDSASNKTGLSDSSQSAYAKFVQAHKSEIDALQKQIDDDTAQIKSAEDSLSVYERGLGVDRVSNWQEVNDAILALEKDRIQKAYDAQHINIDQELIDLRTNATERYAIDEKALEDKLALLEQDPDRNVKEIEQLQAQQVTLYTTYQKELTDIAAQGVQQRRTLQQQDLDLSVKAIKDSTLSLGTKGSSLPTSLTAGLGAGTPQLAGTLAAFMGSQSDNVNGNTMKDAAAQGKLLTQAMEDLLTPTQKFQVLQAEIIPLLDKYKDYPDVVKALDTELLKANPDFQKLQQASAEFGKDLSTEIENMVINGKSLHDVLISLLQDLEKIVLEATLLKPLENFFNGGSSGAGGFPGVLAKLFGVGGGSAAGSSAGLGPIGFSDGFLEGFADGGIPPVGQPSLVGEQGPELFVPHSSGTIIPNGKLGGSTQIFNIDARGAAPGSEVAIMRGIQKAMEKNRQASIAGAIDYQRRR
jgi:hypothetical protein